MVQTPQSLEDEIDEEWEEQRPIREAALSTSYYRRCVERLAECNRLGTPFIAPKGGMNNVPKLELDPSKRSRQRRGRRKRISSKFDKHSSRAASMRKRWADPAYKERVLAAGFGRGTGRKTGSFDGMTYEESMANWAAAREKANKTMDILKENDLVEFPKDDEGRAEAAFKTCLEVMYSASNTKHRLDAATVILKYTKQAPVSRQKVTIENAEAWLAAVAEDNDGSSEPSEAA